MRFRVTLLVASTVLSAPSMALAATWCVPWQCPTIQAGIDSASAGDTVLVASGTYTGVGNRDLNYGGKAIRVCSEAGNPDSCIIDCEYEDRGVTFDSEEGGGSVLEAVTVTRGYSASVGEVADGGAGALCWRSSPTFINCVFSYNWADSWSSQYALGGGMWVQEASPELIDCVFLENEAITHGGGMDCWYESFPTLTRCRFIGNTAGLYGGGMACRSSSSPTLTDCVFLENRAPTGNYANGGGMYCSISSPVLVSCVFEGNSATEHGGGILCQSSSYPELERCGFYDNSAIYGGAISTWADGRPTLTHCTLSGNSASDGSLASYPNCSVTLVNTIVAFGSSGVAVYCEGDGVATLSCCDVYGNSGGDWVGCIASQYGVNGNICGDPLFCGPWAGDYSIAQPSPCAPANSPPGCGLIGADSVGCLTASVAEVNDGDAEGFYLAPNVPNPFNPTTEIGYSIPAGSEPSGVTLVVYNSLGRRVKTLVETNQSGGDYVVGWDGRDEKGLPVASGVYFCHLRWNRESRTTRMVLLK